MREIATKLLNSGRRFTIQTNDNYNYNYYAKFNEIKEVSDDKIPEVGDILIGDISLLRENGVFVNIIKVDLGKYSISAFLHNSKMQRGAPLKNWHSHYPESNTEKDGLEILVEVIKVDNRGCLVKEINPYSQNNYHDVIKSNDLIQLDYYGFKESLVYESGYKSFFNKIVGKKYEFNYSHKYNSFIIDNELYIPVSVVGNEFYATRNFKKFIHLNTSSYYNDNIKDDFTNLTHIRLVDNEKSNEIILETQKKH